MYDKWGANDEYHNIIYTTIKLYEFSSFALLLFKLIDIYAVCAPHRPLRVAYTQYISAPSFKSQLFQRPRPMFYTRVCILWRASTAVHGVWKGSLFDGFCNDYYYNLMT